MLLCVGMSAVFVSCGGFLSVWVRLFCCCLSLVSAREREQKKSKAPVFIRMRFHFISCGRQLFFKFQPVSCLYDSPAYLLVRFGSVFWFQADSLLIGLGRQRPSMFFLSFRLFLVCPDSATRWFGSVRFGFLVSRRLVADGPGAAKARKQEQKLRGKQKKRKKRRQRQGGKEGHASRARLCVRIQLYIFYFSFFFINLASFCFFDRFDFLFLLSFVLRKKKQ